MSAKILRQGRDLNHLKRQFLLHKKNNSQIISCRVDKQTQLWLNLTYLFLITAAAPFAQWSSTTNGLNLVWESFEHYQGGLVQDNQHGQMLFMKDTNLSVWKCVPFLLGCSMGKSLLLQNILKWSLKLKLVTEHRPWSYWLKPKSKLKASPFSRKGPRYFLPRQLYPLERRLYGRMDGAQ